jgi:signal peptidase I
LTSTGRRLWKNEYVQTAVMIGLIVIIVLGFWYGSRAVLNTDYPMLAVASGSMCMLPGPYCDGWSHPFERTLHVGDLIVVEGINVSNINAAPYPDGDIIVFHQLSGDELIVHRAIEKRVQNGEIYFVTKGDGNMGPDQPIPSDHVIGKVVLRIPWIGHLALIMRNSTGVYLIIALIIILVVIELLIPVFRGKKPETTPQQGSQEEQDSTNSGTTTSATS